MAETTLHFPTRCVGVINRLDATSGELERLARAEGSVAVPLDAVLHVVAFEAACLEPLLPVALQIDGLQINKTEVAGDELAPVASFMNLRYLNASKAWDLDDTGIRYLAGLSRLEHLDLCSTQATDAALVSLANLTRLEHLHLGGTHVTPEGVGAFRLRFPRCDVVVDPDMENIAKRAARARKLLTLLVRRVVAGHPLRAEDGDEAVVEVVSRLFPLGTQFERLVPGGPPSPPMIVDDAWGRDDLWASKPVALLGLPPHGSQIRISFPGGSCIVVPWLAARRGERRRPATQAPGDVSKRDQTPRPSPDRRVVALERRGA